MFLPLDNIQPGQILSQYSEWIYFTLVLIFFISIAGIALRRHFDKPYVKPLIISVGLMLTVGVFKYKNQLTAIFEGWGILGTILLVIMAAMIPYGLCRGFGMSAGKAFFLSYILIYILSWVKFPVLYEGLADKNLGLVNLGFLILFIIAIFKVIKLNKMPSFASANLADSSPLRPEIDHEIKVENEEEVVIDKQVEKMTKIEFSTIEDIAESLNEIQGIIETHRNNLPKEERERISHILNRISKEEDIFKSSVLNLQKLFKRLDAVDATHFKELKERMGKVTGKEKKLIKAEISGEEEKIGIEKTIFEFERKLGQFLGSFNKFIMTAVDQIRGSLYPYDAKAYIQKAESVLRDILGMIKETKELEEKLISLVKIEKKLLRKERKDS